MGVQINMPERPSSSSQSIDTMNFVTSAMCLQFCVSRYWTPASLG